MAAWYTVQELDQSIWEAREKLETARVLSLNIADLVATSEGMGGEHWDCIQEMRRLLLDKYIGDVAALVSRRDRAND